MNALPQKYAAVLTGPNSESFDSKLRTTNMIKAGWR